MSFTGFLFAPEKQLQTDVWAVSFGSLPLRTCRITSVVCQAMEERVVERGFVGADRILTPQRVRDEDSPTLLLCPSILSIAWLTQCITYMERRCPARASTSPTTCYK